MSNFLVDSLKEIETYNNLISDIKNKVSPISTYGIIDENLGHILYGLSENLKGQILIVTYDDMKSRFIYEDLRGLGVDNIELFPKKEMLFYNVDAVSFDNMNQRLKVISKLRDGEDLVVIASFEALLDKIITSQTFDDYTIDLEVEKEIDLERLSDDLVKSGYERVNMVEGIGQFSIRGGIVDIFPPNNEYPSRLELFGDEIDTIREFNLITQRSLDNLDKISISPVKEIVLSDEVRETIIDNLSKELEDNKDNEKAYDKFKEYIDLLEDKGHIKNKDILLPYIPEEYIGSILDFFNEDSLMFLDQPKRIEESYNNNQENFIYKITDLMNAGEILPSHDRVYYNFREILEKIDEKTLVYNSPLMVSYKELKQKSLYKFSVKPTMNYQNKIELLKSDINNFKNLSYKILILSGTKERGLRLKDELERDGISAVFSNSKSLDVERSQVVITTGSLNSGFEYPDIQVAIISDKQLFSPVKQKKKKKKSKQGEKILNLADLDIGSYVVHEDHGIGRYEGIEKLEIQGIQKDYLTIRYKDEDKLYIPIDQMNLIQKYIGSDVGKPKINRLHSGDWQKTKAKAKKAVEDMAKDLLELYATREALSGYAFSSDTTWQEEFEERFPYEETDGQLRSTEEIKKDMEKPKPMDRLLCGDVGYGKTEVALRAAFKAIMDGKQVAILVPTTILAQQHYETIEKRFGYFPIKHALMSRFRTPKNQKETIKRLKTGEVDIVVGTHRLLSKDIKFKNLGLLIIDEEQRFGVKDKERLKQMSQNVDVLTLTATPIPRTLHMSLVGIRDMSVIDEPPEERYPIQTYVVEFNEQMIRDAILKEVSRGGQVYFVYNRVGTIDKITAKLRKLVPEASFSIAHGQMGERQLEEEMINFSEGENDVLVCTTIIETGLDIRNVNTIIVYDADKMGLSQLYQLRGRVGRSDRIAYGYFTYERDKVLSEVAEKRLTAIKEFTEFGSGFKIAMRDLEIRGAGNLLGQQQHGHIEAIGYDLYVKFLSEAIKNIKGEEVVAEVSTTIDLNVDGYIPDRFIKDTGQKIEIYKKIASIDSKDYYMELVDEIIDRFGDMPRQVSNLMDISYIKHIAGKNNIVNIIQLPRGIKMDLGPNCDFTPQLIQDLSEIYGRDITFDLSMKPNMVYVIKGDVLVELIKFLEKLDKMNKDKKENIEEK